MPIICQTPRLTIKTWDLDEVERLCRLTRLEGLSEFSLSGYADFTPERAHQWISHEMKRFENKKLGKFSVVLKDSGDPSGVSGLFEIERVKHFSVELNYRYPKIHRGQGYAVEAAEAILQYGFLTLKLPQIFANVDVRNEPSKAVLRKLRMRKVDDIEYEGILAERWVKKSPLSGS